MDEENEMGLFYEWYEGWAYRELHPKMLTPKSTQREVLLAHMIAGNKIIVTDVLPYTGYAKAREATSKEIEEMLKKDNMI